MELSNEDEEQETRQGDGNAEEEEESEMEEERVGRLDEEERETRSAVMCTQAGYAFMDERQKKMDKVTRNDVKRAHIEEEVPEVSTSGSNQQKRTIMKAVTFSKQPANADPIENTTAKTTKALNVP
jgi:hypothetical protein